jgi:hypothetical protein
MVDIGFSNWLQVFWLISDSDWTTKKWLHHENGQINGVQTELADFNISNLSQAGR